jgi:hypothetical protein
VYFTTIRKLKNKLTKDTDIRIANKITLLRSCGNNTEQQKIEYIATGMQNGPGTLENSLIVSYKYILII